MATWQPIDPSEPPPPTFPEEPDPTTTPDAPSPVIFPEGGTWGQVANLRGPAGPPGETVVVGGTTPGYVNEQITAHAIDPTPHPAYDDMPDLSLLFENGLQP